MLRGVLYLRFRTCQVSFDEVSYTNTEVHHARFVRTSLSNHLEYSQLCSANYSSKARSAAPCCAVLCCVALPCSAMPCRAVPCCAVLRCALFRTQYQVSCEVPGTRYRYVRACTRFFFAFFLDCPPSRSASRFFLRKLHPYCRSERDIANKNTAQHRQDHQLCTSSSWHYQLLVAPNRGPLLSAPFTFS